MSDPQLIFVYNANADLFSTITDFAHKILSPSTYACSLCALTYGNFSIKKEWESFIESLPIKTSFLHKDQFESAYSFDTDFPVVFIQENQTLKVLITKQELDSCESLDALKTLVQTKLAEYDQHNYSNL